VVASAAFVVLWGYVFLYDAFVQRRWLHVITFIGVTLVWAAIQEAARRKSDSIDYSSR